MKFGPVPVCQAEGALLAHSTRFGAKTFKKGRLLSAEDVKALEASGLQQVTVARLEPGDQDEDTAASRLATAAQGSGIALEPPFTGRVNLHAVCDGVFIADKLAVDAMNRIDPALTIATLDNHSRVASGRMVATAKVIEFGVSAHAIGKAEIAIRNALTVSPFKPHRIALIATRLPHLKETTMDKTRKVLDQRLRGTGSAIELELRVEHREDAVCEALDEARRAGCDLFILFGASAVADRNDVLPAAVRSAGGAIQRFGLPVDPGNLLMLGTYEGCPLIGAPGCARSPKENGFDWALDRTLAGLMPDEQETTGWGVGGLLMEIHSRPQPRELIAGGAENKVASSLALVILAAGQSRRMGEDNKLLSDLGGTPMIRRIAQQAVDSKLGPVIVVTGHQADAIRQALDGLPVTLAHNPDFASGMGGSLRTGIAAVPAKTAGACVLLGDMPEIAATVLEQLADRFNRGQAKAIVAAAASGRRANPVVWPRSFFPQLSSISGDIGARALLEENRELLELVEIGEDARLDLDTPEALEHYMKNREY